MKMYQKHYVFFALMLFVVSACAHLPGAGKSEEGLREKVVREWEAKLNDDWETVYDLTTDEFKSKVERHKYVEAKSLKIVAYEINEITMDTAQGRAWVHVGFDISYMGKHLKGARTKEEWIWESGKWRLNLQTASTPFGPR